MRSRPSAPPAVAPAPKPATPAAPSEPGWLPDCVYTGEKFETGMAFFADALGRITRFSREPADLANARRLPGQAALPGLVNTHSLSWQRVLRGRLEQAAAASDLTERVKSQLKPEDVFETARMAFTEMLLSGVTAVGEFHEWPPAATVEPNAFATQVLRAAHEVGIRMAFFNVATAGDAAAIDPFLRQTEQLRTEIAGRYAADEAWLGVGSGSSRVLPPEAMKALAVYAHAQRMRLHMRVAHVAAAADAVQVSGGRSDVALLAEQGVVDKRFTAIHGNYLSDDECRILGGARATVCACPSAEQNLARTLAPIEKLLAAGAGLCFGSAGQPQFDILKDARLLEYALRTRSGKRPAIGNDVAKTLFHAATVTGARSLGATGGALEVGRPADFFTVNLYEPSIAGADAQSLLANVLFALERRGIREVWIGARQRIVNGRHPNQGLIIGRFVELQRRLWGA